MTAEERRFLRNMLNSLPAPGDNRAPETRNRSGCESETQQTLFSNHDPFLSEALDLADECFLAL